MMKRYLDKGKWLGLILVAFGLLFAGCQGPSSSEEAAATGSSDVGGIPMAFNPATADLNIGDGGAGFVAPASYYGHTVEVKTGDSACYTHNDLTDCWVKVINRSENFAMANVKLWISYCPTCTTAQFDNVDFTMATGATLHGTGSGDVGVARLLVAPNKPGFGVVEDGDYQNYPLPFNVYGSPTHRTQSVGSGMPFQLLHPKCGQRSIRWDFGGQATNYKFFAWLKTDWVLYSPAGPDGIPGNGDDDSRFNWADRTTKYIQVVTLDDKISANPRRGWYRVGSYQRSTVLSGYGGNGANSLAAGRYFAVNVSAEYPNRLESYAMGVSTNYEFYTALPHILRYDPNTIKRVTVAGKTSATGTLLAIGAMRSCSTVANCARGKDTYTGYTDPSTQTAFGWGYIYTGVNMNAQLFDFFAPAEQYQTFTNGVNASVAATSVIPAMMGHYGVARTVRPQPATLNNASQWVQTGVDAAPEAPMAMYYFRIRSATGVQTPAATFPPFPAGSYRPSGRGSEFLIDQFSGFETPQMRWTNKTLTPSGYAAGADDWASYCYPFMSVDNQGCTGAVQATSVVYGGKETSNSNIKQSGQAVVNYGAFQFWPAFICVN